MSLKAKAKPITDILMTVSLLLLMSYELLGSFAHELIGIVMFALFIVHHVLNLNWEKHFLNGRQTPIRIYQDLLVFLVLISVILSLVSGIMISRRVFTFLNIKSNRTANRIHMLSAYWGFIFMSLHLGVHFNSIRAMIYNRVHLSARIENILKIPCVIICIYSFYAFFKRDIASYLLLKNRFFILGDNEHLIIYIIDYVCVMFTFALFSHLLSQALRKRQRNNIFKTGR